MSGLLQFPVHQYLDQRHRNWVIAEEFGDVMFSGDSAFVHPERAEHIARALLEAARPTRTGTNVIRRPPPQPQPLVIEPRTTRWRDIGGWLGIVAGAAVFVAALAVPLDDPALVVALALGLRGGRLVLDV